MGTKNALTEKVYSGKDIMRIAYPILISLLMEQMIGMTDTAFLGRVGEVELGAAAIAGIYYLAVFMMGFGFGVGAQILIARRNGEKHYDEIGEIFYQGIYFMLGLALFAFLRTKIISPYLLPVIGSCPMLCSIIYWCSESSAFRHWGLPGPPSVRRWRSWFQSYFSFFIPIVVWIWSNTVWFILCVTVGVNFAGCLTCLFGR